MDSLAGKQRTPPGWEVSHASLRDTIAHRPGHRIIFGITSGRQFKEQAIQTTKILE